MASVQWLFANPTKKRGSKVAKKKVTKRKNNPVVRRFTKRGEPDKVLETPTTKELAQIRSAIKKSDNDSKALFAKAEKLKSSKADMRQAKNKKKYSQAMKIIADMKKDRKKAQSDYKDMADATKSSLKWIKKYKAQGFKVKTRDLIDPKSGKVSSIQPSKLKVQLKKAEKILKEIDKEKKKVAKKKVAKKKVAKKAKKKVTKKVTKKKVTKKASKKTSKKKVSKKKVTSKKKVSKKKVVKKKATKKKATKRKATKRKPASKVYKKATTLTIAKKRLSKATKKMSKKAKMKMKVKRGKKKFTVTTKRNNPYFGGKTMKNVQKVIKHDLYEAGGLVIGGLASNAIYNNAMPALYNMSWMPSTVKNYMNNLGTLGGSVVSILSGIGISMANDKFLKKNANLEMLSKGIIGAGLVGIGSSVYAKTPLATPTSINYENDTMEGLDYEDGFEGIDSDEGFEGADYEGGFEGEDCL